MSEIFEDQETTREVWIFIIYFLIRKTKQYFTRASKCENEMTKKA